MKFKIMLLALPFMALTTLFTFCTKEQDSTTVNEQTNTIKEEATDRGGPCSIVLTATLGASVCGTANGSGTCTDCGGANTYAGSALFGPNAPHTFQTSSVDGKGTIRNLAPVPNAIRVSINGVVVQQVLFGAFECRSITAYSDNPCTFVIN